MSDTKWDPKNWIILKEVFEGRGFRIVQPADGGNPQVFDAQGMRVADIDPVKARLIKQPEDRKSAEEPLPSGAPGSNNEDPKVTTR